MSQGLSRQTWVIVVRIQKIIIAKQIEGENGVWQKLHEDREMEIEKIVSIKQSSNHFLVETRNQQGGSLMCVRT